MARNEGLDSSGTRSWRYWPARVWDEARSGASVRSMQTWKSDSAAGSISESGAWVQSAVSWRTAAATLAKRWRRSFSFRWLGLRRRKIDMGGRGELRCAWELRRGTEAGWKIVNDMAVGFGLGGFYVCVGGLRWEKAGAKAGDDTTNSRESQRSSEEPVVGSG